jgi:hypothetical protein
MGYGTVIKYPMVLSRGWWAPALAAETLQHLVAAPQKDPAVLRGLLEVGLKNGLISVPISEKAQRIRVTVIAVNLVIAMSHQMPRAKWEPRGPLFTRFLLAKKNPTS